MSIMHNGPVSPLCATCIGYFFYANAQRHECKHNVNYNDIACNGACKKYRR